MLHAHRQFVAGLALIGTIGVSSTVLGQNSIPVLEDRYTLRYTWPMDDAGEAIAPAPFDIGIKGHETITRPDRVTAMHYDGSMRLSFLGQSAASIGEDEESALNIDLDVLVDALRLNRKAGAGSYSLVLDERQLVERRPTTGHNEYERADPYYKTHSLQSLIDRPGVLHMRNGALRDTPKTPALLTALDVAWTYDELPLLLPPLPTRDIPVGRSWRASMPVRLSLYAQSAIIRFDLTFAAYDEQTGVATVTWEAAPTNFALKPVAGVHHIRARALATNPVIRGRLELHVPTGTVVSSRSVRTTHIAHVGTSDVEIAFAMEITLTNPLVEVEAEPQVSGAGADEGMMPIGPHGRE